MEQCPELSEDIWEIILDHLKLECNCMGIKYTVGGDLVIPPYSQIKFVNKLFYSKLYFPPPSLIDPLYVPPPPPPFLPLPCLPPIAIRYHDVKINIEFAPHSSKDENS